MTDDYSTTQKLQKHHLYQATVGKQMKSYQSKTIH